MIIDVHTHYGVGFEEQHGTDPGRWLEGLDEAGIDGAVLMTHRGLLQFADVRACNDLVAKVAQRAPDRLVAFGTVHPFAGQESLHEAERCVNQHGMKGIKLHPWLQGFPFLGGREINELCELCGGLRVPLAFHDGTSNVSMPSQVAKLAKAHPATTFVLCHAGIVHLWRQAAEAAALYDNIYVVLCGSHLAGLRHVCDSVPAERILWGSDYGFGATNVAPYRKDLIGLLGLDEGRLDSVMSENAARLLNWRPRPLTPAAAGGDRG